ncbi:hypothetical protein D3C71_1444750 [compost metagenome]
MAQRRIQLRDHFRRGPLLRAKHRGGSVSTTQRIIHVAGRRDAHLLQTRIHPGKIDIGQLRQRGPSRRQSLSILVQQSGPQRLHHAGPAVVGGAAANAKNNRLNAALQRSQDQLTGAITGGHARISLRLGSQMQPGSRRHLDNGSFSLSQQTIEGLYRLAQRPSDRDRNDFPAGGCHHRIHRAFAAVRHG